MSWTLPTGAGDAGIEFVSATDKVLGRSSAGAGSVEEIACTSAGRAILDDADATAQRVTLGVVIGTNVQAWDADLDDIAALADVQGDVIVRGASGWERLAAGTAGQSLRTRGASTNPGWAYQLSANPYRTDFVETFIGGSVTSGSVGDYGWNFSVGTGSVAVRAPVAGHAGCRRVTTGAVATNTTVMYKGSGGSVNPNYLASDMKRVSLIVALSSHTALQTFLIGPTDNGNNSTATEWLGFKFDPAVSANWQSITKTSGGTEATTTNVAVTAGNWYLLEFELDEATGNWTPYINGTAKTAHSTYKPATATLLPTIYHITNDTGAVYYDIDTFIINGIYTTQPWT